MGTFGGHALPGSFFVVFAVWWTIQMFRRYFSSRVKSGVQFKSTVTFPVDFICCGPAALRRWEWEGFFKVFFTLVGFLGEVITGTEDGQFRHLGNGQHATMFFFFGLHHHVLFRHISLRLQYKVHVYSHYYIIVAYIVVSK